MYDIGFLGLGKMGFSIASGIIKKELFLKEDIAFYAPSDKTKEKGKNLGIYLVDDERNLFISSKIIIIAIEPQKYGEVFVKLEGIDFKNKTIISLAPGKSIAYLKSIFKDASIMRAMPNTPSMINHGVTTLAFDKEIDDEVINIFSSIGIVEVVEENQIDKAIPLHGSMPAYIFEFVKAFTDTALEYGIEKEKAKSLALHAIIGSCMLALDSNEDLDTLIDRVCSRGGSTIAGLEKMRESGFSEAIKNCYKACVKRSKELQNS